MAVQIDIELQAGDAEAEILGIASALETLDDAASDADIDLDFDGDDITGQIGEMVKKLENLDLDLSGLDEQLTRIEALDDIDIQHQLNTPDGSTGSGDSTGSDPPVQIASGFEKAARKVQEATDGGDRASIFERTYGPDAVHISDSDIGSLLKTRESRLSNLGEYSPLVPEYDSRQRTAIRGGMGLEPLSMGDRRLKLASSYQELADMHGLDLDLGGGDSGKIGLLPGDMDAEDLAEAAENFSGFGGILRKVKPTMGQYMQLLAALIPIAVALGVQLAGVAAAMGSVAAAGGAIIGMGLLGHAESLSGSVAQAKAELRGLKMELFEVAQPTMQQFASIQSRAFDAAPQALQPVFEEMEGLTSYEDTLFNLGGALAGGMERAVEIINENERAISQLTTRFGGLLGSGLLNFFEWLIQAASKNQDLLVQLGEAMLDLAVIAYRVVMALARILNTLRPVVDLVLYFSQFLDNKLVMALLTFISVAYITVAVLSKLGITAMVALNSMGIFGSGSFIGSILGGLSAVQASVAGLIMEYTALSEAAAMAAAAIAMTGVGLLAVGAGTVAAGAMLSNSPTAPVGSGSGTGGMGGSQMVYNDNRQFTINNNGGGDYASQKSIEDAVKEVGETQDAQSLPPVETSSETSDK